MTRKKKPSRATRWADAVSRALAAAQELQELQQEFVDWKDNLPENLASSPLGEKLDAITDGLDIDTVVSTLEEAEGAEIPLGFGGD